MIWTRLRRLKLTPTDLARRLSAHTRRGMSSATLHPWLYGISVPSDANKEALEAVLAVPRGAWLRTPSKAIVVGLD